MNINDIPLQRLKEILASDMPLTIVTTEALIARLEQAEAAVARVREKHRPFPVTINNDPKPTDHCRECYDVGLYDAEYPCPTIRALDGEPNE